MPSERQAGHDTDEWTSQADRVCAEWSDKALLRLHPMGEELSRTYLGAANRHERSPEVKRHFAEVVKEQTE